MTSKEYIWYQKARNLCRVYIGFMAVALLTCILHVVEVSASVSQDSVGSVRVQFLSPILVRIEQKGPDGFLNAKSYMVVKRDWPDVAFTKEVQGTSTIFKTANYEVDIPNNGSSITGAVVKTAGQTVFTYSTRPVSWKLFPPPNQLGTGWVIGDGPRVIPPEWGATTMPDGALPTNHPLYATQGWDYRADRINTPDVYVFVNTNKGLESWHAIRKDFLQLTGPIPMLPLYMLGFMSSRWYPYTQAQLIEVVDRFRSENIPLDLLVVDTDWRASVNNYNYSSQYFPTPTKFWTDIKQRNSRVMFNDHPQGSGTDYKKFMDEHSKKYTDGLDCWWFDRNWATMITSPVSGIDMETWGSRLFVDIMQKSNANKRAFTMGMRTHTPGGDERPKSQHGTDYQPHVAHHRYPIWWTGDISSTWSQLRQGIITIVDDGINFLPWVGTDIAGFMDADPGDDLYTRWMQMGCFSPNYRIHGYYYDNEGLKRYPWQFTAQTKVIVTRYIMLRYRLFPIIYGANRRTFDDGTPLCKRLDFEWTGTDAMSDEQYLFAEDLLIKPCTVQGSTMTAGKDVTVWLPTADWFDAWTGEKKTAAGNVTVNSKVWHTPMFVRQGAIICQAPDMEYSSEKNWDPVIVDIFPPKDGRSTRILYEDDKESPKYISGEFCTTGLTVDRGATGMRLGIGAATGNYTGKLPSRAWVARLHLDVPHTNQQVKVDGAVVTLGTTWTQGTQAEARKHDPTAWPTTITEKNFPLPFSGIGSKPGPNAPGPVIEVWVPAGATSTPREVSYGEPPSGTSVFKGMAITAKAFKVIPQGAGSLLKVQFVVPVLEDENDAQPISVLVYNMSGKIAGELVNGRFAPGNHTIVNSDLKPGAGMYIARLSINNKIRVVSSFTILR